jgi:ArsR family transcriptional regulator, arsenate/arsenite/antimonite-responsive transcriptional repressor
METLVAPRSLPQIETRRPGERCCDPDALPRLTMEEATSVTGDLEILAHPIRLQLLDMLTRKEGEVCVCDLEAAVPVKQPTVSHHLRLLREAGLIHSDKRGLYAYYRVDRRAVAALRKRITAGLSLLDP